MQTAELVHAHEPTEVAEQADPADEPAEPTPTSRRRRGARELVISAVFVLGATLTFGLIGLLVAVWRLTRARPDGPDGPAGPGGHAHCPDCRRRRHRTVAGIAALAALVVSGTAVSVHQQVAGPALPACAQELPEPAPFDAGDPFAQVVGGVWQHTRRALTAPVSGLTRHVVADRGGGLCDVGSMTVASLPAGASGSSVAVGSIVLTASDSNLGRGASRKLARHESRHVSQWATLTIVGGPLAMPVAYVVDDAFFPESRNHFERAAGLWAGGYDRPESFGPRVDWPKAAVLAAFVVAVGWRRLRWASRVFTGGAAAGRAGQNGLCPVHSRGWFRLREPA